MKIIRTDEAAFEGEFRRIRERGRIFDPELWAAVGRIVEDVGRRGDEALFDYTARWDGHAVTAATVEASPEEIGGGGGAGGSGGSGDPAPGRRADRAVPRTAAPGGVVGDGRGGGGTRPAHPSALPGRHLCPGGLGLLSLHGPDDGDPRPDRRRRRDHPRDALPGRAALTP